MAQKYRIRNFATFDAPTGDGTPDRTPPVRRQKKTGQRFAVAFAPESASDSDSVCQNHSTIGPLPTAGKPPATSSRKSRTRLGPSSCYYAPFTRTERRLIKEAIF